MAISDHTIDYSNYNDYTIISDYICDHIWEKPLSMQDTLSTIKW